MSDISAIVAQSRVVDILHPATQEPIGLKVTLLPMSDDKVEGARRRIQNRRLSSRKANVTAEQMDAEGVELLAASIAGWEWVGDANFQGEQPECTPDSIRRIMKALPWVKKQIDQEAGYDEAFFEA